MKKLAFLTALIALFLSSCVTNESTAVDKEGNVIVSDFTKKIKMPLHPCEHISRDMIVKHFDVEEADLELNEDFSDPESYYATCGYKWKKPNYKELEEKQRDAMMEYVMQGMNKKEGDESKTTLSDITKLEFPNATVMVGNFRQYDDMQSAMDQFINSHRVPTKEDLAVLNKEIDKEFDKKGLSEKSKKTGKELSGGIAGSLNFTEITGIGDKAFYDHLNRSLDVRFGTFSFKVIIDSSLDFESNLEIAKEIAQEVWDKL